MATSLKSDSGALMEKSFSGPEESAKPSNLFLVEADPKAAERFQEIFANRALEVTHFQHGADFLELADATSTGVVLLDEMPMDMSGFQLLDAMAARDIAMPAIIMSASPDYELTREAFKKNAFDVLPKTTSPIKILEAVFKASELEQERLSVQRAGAVVNPMLDALSARETEILDLLFAGNSTKEIARHLDIAPRTIDVHRSNILRKLGISSVFQLVPALSAMGYFEGKYDLADTVKALSTEMDAKSAASACQR